MRDRPLVGCDMHVMLCLVCVTSTACAADAATSAQAWPPVVIQHVSVIPMDSERMIEDVTVVVSEGRVRAVGSDQRIAVPDDAVRVDGSGRFLIPGLWDMHVHFSGPPEILGMFLAAGVTGARVMRGTPDHLTYRDMVSRGELVGPDLYVAGTIVEGEPPPELRSVISTAGRAMVHDSAEGAAVVREQSAAGYDFIKVYNNVPAEAYRGIVVAAEAAGIPVAGHVPFEVGLEGALRAGQRTIEHLRGYVWHLVPDDAPNRPGADLRSRTIAWAHGDLARVERLATGTRAAGVWNVPTLAVRLITKPDAYIDGYLASEEATHLSDGMRRFYTERRSIPWLSNFTDQDFVAAMEGFAVGDSLIRALAGLGAGVMAGTDTPPIGFALHRELAELVNTGLTPYQALAAATRNPALFLGRESAGGMVTVGSPADLVVLEGNPLEDIANTRRIAGLVRRGQWYDRTALDRLLAEASAQ